MSHSPIIRVAAGLVFREGKLLVAQRRQDQHLGGYWEFPGGKLEPGETPQACLVRELDEELGIEVNVLDLIEEVEHAYPEKTVSIGFYRCAWLRHEPRTLQCAAVAWTTQSALPSFQFPPADVRLLSKLVADSGLWR